MVWKPRESWPTCRSLDHHSDGCQCAVRSFLSLVTSIFLICHLFLTIYSCSSIQGLSVTYCSNGLMTIALTSHMCGSRHQRGISFLSFPLPSSRPFCFSGTQDQPFLPSHYALPGKSLLLQLQFCADVLTSVSSTEAIFLNCKHESPVPFWVYLT